MTEIKPFIELPDKSGDLHRYILIPYAIGYNDFISQYIKSNTNKTIHVSTDCRTDAQCFSNKCLNNTCTYNVEANIERCDTIRTRHTLSSPSKEYTNCGRMVGEVCTKSSDCSFNSCSNGECSFGNYGHYDTDVIKVDIQKICIKASLVIILIIIICCCCCCYFVRRHKKNNIKVENNNNIKAENNNNIKVENKNKFNYFE